MQLSNSAFFSKSGNSHHIHMCAWPHLPIKLMGNPALSFFYTNLVLHAYIKVMIPGASWSPNNYIT